MGTAAIPSSTILNNQAALDRARTEQEKLVLALAATESSRILFHYTDNVSARMIFGCQCIIATPTYYGHINGGDGYIRPSGAYATPLPPWNPAMTQRDLASFIFRKPQGKDVSFAAVIRNVGDWQSTQATYLEWVKRAPPGAPVPAQVITTVPNLMKP